MRHENLVYLCVKEGGGGGGGDYFSASTNDQAFWDVV